MRNEVNPNTREVEVMGYNCTCYNYQGEHEDDCQSRFDPIVQRSKKPITEAPKDGTEIIGIYEDGTEVVINWADQRKCMLAGVGGGNGYFGPGWEDSNLRLIVDEPPYFYSE